MSTIVYQGSLQSCFESQIIETTTIKLKVPTPSTIEFGRGPCLTENDTENLKEKCQNKPSSTTTTSNLDLGGGWSCIQTLSNISKEEGSNIYVHPLFKRSSYSSRLSAKSLELCTESLGSETGSSDIMDCSIFSSSSSSYSTFDNSPSSIESSSSSTWSRTCNKSRTKKKNSCTTFPPPLTTIRGSNSLQFRPHREDGRLIIKAVESPFTHNYLQAERSNGRLRLCLYNDEISNFDSVTTLEENDMFENDNEEEEVEDGKLEEEEAEEAEEEESDMYNNVKWDIDGNNFEVEGEMGMDKCQSWLSRCKEGGQDNKVFCDWGKPLWVATS